MIAINFFYNFFVFNTVSNDTFFEKSRNKYLIGGISSRYDFFFENQYDDFFNFDLKNFSFFVLRNNKCDSVFMDVHLWRGFRLFFFRLFYYFFENLFFFNVSIHSFVDFFYFFGSLLRKLFFFKKRSIFYINSLLFPTVFRIKCYKYYFIKRIKFFKFLFFRMNKFIKYKKDDHVYFKQVFKQLSNNSYYFKKLFNLKYRKFFQKIVDIKQLMWRKKKKKVIKGRRYGIFFRNFKKLKIKKRNKYFLKKKNFFKKYFSLVIY